MNSVAQGFPVEVTMTDDSYTNISEIKLSITSLFSVQIMSHLGVSDIIYSDVVDNFIYYESSVIVSSTEKPWGVLFTTRNIYQRQRWRFCPNTKQLGLRGLPDYHLD